MTVVAMVGVAGVGKSTLLARLSSRIGFTHWRASELIGRERARVSVSPSVARPDLLRDLDIDDNQRLLVEGFRRARAETNGPIFLDGHTLIETSTGLVDIGATVFAAIGIVQLFFLADDPERIVARRASDTSRDRVARSPDELAAIQARALANAFDVALKLEIPLTVVTPTCEAFIANLLGGSVFAPLCGSASIES